MADFTNSGTKLLNTAQEVREVGSVRRGRGAYMLAELPKAMGLVILLMMLAMWKGQSMQKTSDAAGHVVQLSGDPDNQKSCRRATGGTCFLTGCAAYRGNTSCDVSLGISMLGWHGCNCQSPTPCAHSDGKCYSNPEEGWRQRLQGESELIVFFALAPVMRSGVTQLFSRFLALDHLVSIPSKAKVKIDFHALKSWDDVRKESNFEYYWQAIAVSAIKAGGLHAMQPFLFVVPYAAYSKDMGWIQFVCATFVVLNELWYLFIIPYAMRLNPKWLLYPPLSDTTDPLSFTYEKPGPVAYFVAPAFFITASIDCWGFMFFFSAFYGIFASVCAWVALAVGLVGNGVMFPSLLIGYILSAFEALVVAYNVITSFSA